MHTAIKAMTEIAIVWAPDPSDLGKGLKQKPCWNHDEGVRCISVKHFSSRFYPRPFLAQSEWSGVQTVTGIGNLQFLKQFQRYVAAMQATRYR